MENGPQISVLAGPNGAGKSTAATVLLPQDLPFLNADEIAKTLPGYPSTAVDIQAGRLLIERLAELEHQRASFAIETTLASRTLAPRIARLRRSEYRFRLIFVFVPDVELSIQRVAGRVRQGGHHIPEDTIRRRYQAGISNFLGLYMAMADEWSVHDTTEMGEPKLIANGIMTSVDRIEMPDSWKLLMEIAHHA
jgi:predicted ABC-type ATPase